MANLFDSSGSNMFNSSSTNMFGDVDNNKRLTDRLKRESLLKSIIDGDTLGKARLVGIDSMESQNLGNGNERAQAIKDEYGISFEDQLRLGTLAKEELKKQIIEGNYDIDSVGLEQGRDVYGRRLIYNQDLQEKLLQSGLYAPTDRYDKKSQDLFRKAQEKTARVNSKQAEIMEAQRQYNISGQAPGILDRLGAPIDAFQSGAQQFVAGTGDFLLDVVTPGNNTWLDEAKSAESADKNWGYDRKEAQFQQDELMDDWKQGNYGSALGTAALLAPEVIGESLPMMASMLTPTGLGRAAVVGVGAKVLGATAKAAKAEGAIREANALSKFATSMTDDGFMLAVGTTTNNHIDEFTANNGGVGPSYGEIARMTAINALQLGTDKFAFQDIVGAGPLTGFVKAMKPMTKVVPDNVLGSIGVGVARTAMAMGEEAGQEYFQTWAEILNGQLGTTKYGSMQQILANEQNQDEATLGALLGAGAGGGMHIAAMPVNALLDKFRGDQEKISKANAKQAELLKQIVSGQLDLDANPISFSGDSKEDALLDVISMATSNKSQIATSIVEAAMRPDVDTALAIGSVDASLKKAFNVGENIGSASTAPDETMYQDVSYKVALSALNKLSETSANLDGKVDTSPQMEEVMKSYGAILSPDRYAMLHMNLLNKAISSLQSAGLKDAANDGDTIKGKLKSGGDAYKVSTDFLISAINSLRASGNAIKGSYGETGGGSNGIGSVGDALTAIQEFSKNLEARVADAKKNGKDYTEFTGSPYDALKGTKQVASEILIKGKTGVKGVYGKGLIQHASDISNDIVSATEKKNKKISKANLTSFVKFAVSRVKKSVYNFNQSILGGDFKNTFFPRSDIMRTDKDPSDPKSAYVDNYHPEMDPGGRAATQKIAEANYMLNMTRRMIRLLVMSKKNLDPKSYEDAMADLELVAKRQEEDIAELNKVIDDKIHNNSGMVAVLINKYLEPPYSNGEKDIPDNVVHLVEQFKAAKKDMNLGNDAFFYVYVPLINSSSSVAGTNQDSEQEFDDNYIEEDSDYVTMYDENGDDLVTSSGSSEQEDATSNGSESETKAKVDENVDNKLEDGKLEPLKEEQPKDEIDEQDSTSDEQKDGEGASSGDSGAQTRAARSREIPQRSQEAKSALKKLEEELESLKSELAAKIQEVSDAMEEPFITDSDSASFSFDKSISLTKNMAAWRKAIVQKIKDNRATKAEAKETKDQYKEAMPSIKDTRKDITAKKKEVRKAESNVRAAERREASKKFFIEELKISYENNEQLWKADSGSESSFAEASIKEKNTHFNDMWNKHKAEVSPEFDPSMFNEEYNKDASPETTDNESTTAEPKSSEAEEEQPVPKLNMFQLAGQHTKAKIDKIDAKIASLKEEEKALRSKRVEEIVVLKMADSNSMIFSGKGLSVEENAAREERDKRFRREAHLQVNKEFRGCF